MSKVMQKEEVTILIVDDDATMGKALKEAFARAGFKALHVTKPDEALSLIKLQPIHGAVIDCMLPKMNGQELTKKLKEQTSKGLPVFLISGIYKDKNFAREALHKTGALGFLTKPFDTQELVEEMNVALEQLIDTPLAPLQSIFTKDTVTPTERIAAVNKQVTVHGYELPWVFTTLMYPKISGHLNIVAADGDTSTVGFQDGKIVQVSLKDSRSYFGVLMVEYGFITQTELDEVMRASSKSKKMGERLVDANVLSPHAIEIVMAEQQAIRLGKTIKDTQVKISFSESEEVAEDVALDRSAFVELVNDWLMSKIPGDWLKGFYRSWMRYNVKLGPEHHPRHKLLMKSVLQRTPKFMQALLENLTVDEAFHAATEPEEYLFASLHALMVSRILRFGEPIASFDYTAQKNRLMKLAEDLSKQNFFERLGLNNRAKEPEIRRAYHDLAKVLHPDKLSTETPQEIRELARTAFNMITEAYETLTNASAREEYLLEMEKGKAEAILEAEQLKEQCRTLLGKGDFKKARELIERSIELAPPASDTRLLHMWTRLKSPGTEGAGKAAAAVREGLQSIPPEDRHNSIYYFVKGLNLRLLGDHGAARKSLEHAISMEPQFVDARRELSSLESQTQKPVDFLRGDLKDVMGALFGKKK